MISSENIRYYYDLEFTSGLSGMGSDSEEFWIWLNTDGLQKYPELKNLLSPFPDEELRVIVSGMTDTLDFARSGAKLYSMLTEILKSRGLEWQGIGKVLDFACGCGRVARLLLKHSHRISVFGSDINDKHIGWLNNKLGFGSFVTNQALPPVPFQGASFDLIYCVSLFSHLNEETQLLWLEELARICKKTGLAILTTHGSHAYTVLKQRDDIRERMGISKTQLEQAGEKMRQDGFAFLRQDDSYLDKDSYGFTFISRAYIEKVWTRFYHLVEVKEGAVDDWQDAVVLLPKT